MIEGACVSFTVTVNEHVSVVLWPMNMQVTLVVPLGKNEPLAGEQIVPPQPPLDIGAG